MIVKARLLFLSCAALFSCHSKLEVGFASGKNSGALRNVPKVQSITPTSSLTPTWTWSTEETKSQFFRYRLDNSDFTNDATQTKDTTFTPKDPLSIGSHTLYVQKKLAMGEWSQTGSFAVLIDTTPPVAANQLVISDRVNGNSITSSISTGVYLRWDAGTDSESGVKGYSVSYYRQAGCAGAPTAISGLTSNQYSFTGVPRELYSFSVTTYNNAGLSKVSICSGALKILANEGYTLSMTPEGFTTEIDQYNGDFTVSALVGYEPKGFRVFKAGIEATGLTCPSLPTNYAKVINNTLFTFFGIRQTEGSIQIPCSSDFGPVQFNFSYPVTRTALVSFNTASLPWYDNTSAQASSIVDFSSDGTLSAYSRRGPNGKLQIFLKSVSSGLVSMVSTVDGTTAGDGDSEEPQIANDNSFILFQTTASNLGATGGSVSQIVKKSLTNPALPPVVVSVASDGVTIGTASSSSVQISADGSFSVFVTTATNLGVTSGQTQIVKKSLTNLATPPIVLSVLSDGVTIANAACSEPKISSDGSFLIFQSNAINLGAGGASTQIIKKSLSNLSTPPVVISVASDGTTIGNGHSLNAQIAADGSFVIFHSYAANLGAVGGVNSQIIKKNLNNLATAPVVISVTSDGTTIGNGYSATPQISADMSFVVFVSSAANLGASGSFYQIVKKSLTNLAIAPVVVSIASDGVTIGTSNSTRPQISPDGSFVLFLTTQSNLHPSVVDYNILKKNLSNLATPIEVWNTWTYPGRIINGGVGSYTPQFSADNSFALFMTNSPNMSSSVNKLQVVRKSLSSFGAAPEVVSVTSDGTTNGTGQSSDPLISPDGSFALFSSNSANLGATGGANYQIIKKSLLNLATPTTVVSVTGDGTTIGNGDSVMWTAQISADGSFLVFTSKAANLGATGGTNYQIIKKSLTNLATPPVVVSVTSDGSTIGNSVSYAPQISADGSFVVFSTSASNLGATGGISQIIKKSLTNLSTPPVVVSVASNGSTIGNGNSYNPRVSADGTFVVFDTLAANLGATGGTVSQIVKKSLTNLATAPVVLSVAADGTTIGNAVSVAPVLSPDGSFVVFHSHATNFGASGSYLIIKKNITNLASAPVILNYQSDGITVGNGFNVCPPSISPNGTYVGFCSLSQGLGAFLGSFGLNAQSYITLAQ